MSSPPDELPQKTLQCESEGGVDMQALCKTLARLFVLVTETGYTDDNQQAAVFLHDDLLDQASESAPARLR